MTIEMVGKSDVVLGHAKTYANETETELESENMDESSETEKAGEMQEGLRTRQGHQEMMHIAMERHCLHIGFHCHMVCMAGPHSRPFTMADTCSGKAGDRQGRQPCLRCLIR